MKSAWVLPEIDWLKSATKDSPWPSDQEIRAVARIEGHRGLIAEVTFRSSSDRRVVAELIVRPTNRDVSALPSGGVTVDAVRAVRLGKIQDEVSEILARDRELGRIPKRLLDGFERVPRPGRRKRPLREYAAFAAEYVQLLGTSRPIKELARRHHCSESSARAILNRAREKGLLTRSPDGRAGGQLTNEAQVILKEAQEGK